MNMIFDILNYLLYAVMYGLCLLAVTTAVIYGVLGLQHLFAAIL